MLSVRQVYEIHADRKLSIPCNPYLNFIETDFKDLPSTISYNKCVTAVDQDFLDAAIKQIKPDLFQDYEILNLGRKCCWMVP